MGAVREVSGRIVERRGGSVGWDLQAAERDILTISFRCHILLDGVQSVHNDQARPFKGGRSSNVDYCPDRRHQC